MKADNQTASEVKAVLASFADAYARRDLKAVMACVANDDDMVMYGTGADERRVGPKEVETQAQRDWDQTESAAMRFDKIAVSAAGNVAWAAIDGAFELRAGGQNMKMPTRASVVLEKRGGKWLIVHAHFSMPSGGQEPGNSF
jgi:ketosteroid isomerase-like protein